MMVSRDVALAIIAVTLLLLAALLFPKFGKYLLVAIAGACFAWLSISRNRARAARGEARLKETFLERNDLEVGEPKLVRTDSTTRVSSTLLNHNVRATVTQATLAIDYLDCPSPEPKITDASRSLGSEQVVIRDTIPPGELHPFEEMITVPRVERSLVWITRLVDVALKY